MNDNIYTGSGRSQFCLLAFASRDAVRDYWVLFMKHQLKLGGKRTV